jgi:hypothetical protein
MVAWISPPVPAGGACRAPVMDATRTEPPVKRATERREGARAEELNKLRLALATFALQLDVFEMRASKALKVGVKPEMPILAHDAGCKLQKENDRWSIRSHGKKPDA